MNVFAWYFPTYITLFNDREENTKGEKRKVKSMEKDHSSHPQNSFRCQGVSDDGRVCSLQGQVPSLGTVFLLKETCIEHRTSSSTCKSHHDDKHLPSSPLKDTRAQVGLISIKGVRDVS